MSLYNSGVRQANWVEEEAMQALTGFGRNVPIASTSKKQRKPPSMTAARIIAHSDAVDPKDWKAASRGSYSAPGRASNSLNVGGLAPREARILAKLQAEAQAEAAQEEAKQQKKDRRGRYETTSSEIVGSTTFGSIGRRVMKTRSGGPVHGLDDAAYEFGLHERKSKLSDEELLKRMNASSYLTDQPISVYTQKSSEGGISISAGTGSNPFARNGAFTSDIKDTNVISSDPATTNQSGLKTNGGGLALVAVLDKIKQNIRRLAGNNGIKSIGRMFKIVDDSGDRKISKGELRNGLRDYGVQLTPQEQQVVFMYLDRDNSGTINFDEFLRALANDMSARRLNLVKMAYKKLDTTGDGRVTIEDIRGVYDVSQNPEVIAGKLTPQQAFEKFMKQWETDKVDGVVTEEEFIEYYRDVSPSIDRDDYFELMIRNAWHLPGGSGVAANTTNRRLMVTQRDGTQSVQTIADDLGIKSNEFDRMRAALHRQGVHKVVAIELSDGSKRVWK